MDDQPYSNHHPQKQPTDQRMNANGFNESSQVKSNAKEL